MTVTSQTFVAGRWRGALLAVVPILPGPSVAFADDCRTPQQIYVELESFGYKQIELLGEASGRLQASARDHNGKTNLLTIDACSGEVVRVQRSLGTTR